MKLPAPQIDDRTSLTHALAQRRTTRRFRPQPPSLAQCAQLLWAAHGVSAPGGFKRTIPSAGALYPLDIYLVWGTDHLPDLRPGSYHYEPQAHELRLIAPGDFRQPLAEASLHQTWMAGAPLSIVITAEYARITGKYGDRGYRYAHMESGNVSQNIFLQAEALGLKAGIVGAFHDRRIGEIIHAPPVHEPLLIMPVGYGEQDH